jgi:hypothetical protein
MFHLLIFVILPVVMIVGCDMAPVKPEQVFILYREKMNSHDIQETRKLLSADSLQLLQQIEERHKLDQPPENITLLNILDPVTPPVLIKVDDLLAILQLRTLKGGNRLIRLTRTEPNSPWKIDMTEELKSLQLFLEAREALSGLQQQAGEFAASWKALENQLQKMGGPESESQSPALTKTPPQKTGKPKPTTRQIKKKEDKSSTKDPH